jgi:hypothetical protein
MTRQTCILSSIAFATVFAVATLAQDNPPPAPSASMDITGIPASRGVYYRANDEWVSLSHTVLMPFWEGRSTALEILNVGSDHTVSELPGSHAGVQIGNDARPTFYLHGISPADVYLVRAVTKEDYRELRMPVSRHFNEWAHYRGKDVMDFQIQGVNGDIVAIKPRVDLKPGEYALSSVFEAGERWVRLGFDFGIAGPITGQ